MLFMHLFDRALIWLSESDYRLHPLTVWIADPYSAHLFQAFRDNLIEGGAQNTITPLEDRFGISVEANCIQNGIPEFPLPGVNTLCSETDFQPFLVFSVSVPANTVKGKTKRVTP